MLHVRTANLGRPVPSSEGLLELRVMLVCHRIIRIRCESTAEFLFRSNPVPVVEKETHRECIVGLRKRSIYLKGRAGHRLRFREGFARRYVLAPDESHGDACISERIVVVSLNRLLKVINGFAASGIAPFFEKVASS